MKFDSQSDTISVLALNFPRNVARSASVMEELGIILISVLVSWCRLKFKQNLFGYNVYLHVNDRRPKVINLDTWHKGVALIKRWQRLEFFDQLLGDMGFALSLSRAISCRASFRAARHSARSVRQSASICFCVLSPKDQPLRSISSSHDSYVIYRLTSSCSQCRLAASVSFVSRQSGMADGGVQLSYF